MRDNSGKFLPKPIGERLGAPIGVRVRVDLMDELKELAAIKGVTPTEFCREVLEGEIVKRSCQASRSAGV